MSPIKTLFSALLLAALATGQAQAAQYTGFSSQGEVGVTDYSSAGLLAFDLDFSGPGQVRLNFSIDDAQDLTPGAISFNALVRNLSGLGFSSASLRLEGAAFALPFSGTLTTDGFQSVEATGGDAQWLWARFSPPGVTSEFYIGNPLDQPDAADWALDLSSRQLGESFSITLAVPEPESYALVLAGLAAMGWAARRGGRRRR